MERSSFTLLALLCVVCSRAEVEVRVRRGENVTLPSDCAVSSGFHPVWFRNCSHEDQPPIAITRLYLFTSIRNGAPSRYEFLWNPSNSTHSLLIWNVSEADVGVYYCAVYEKDTKGDEKGRLTFFNSYRYGNRSTRLALQEEASACVSSNAPSPCETECCVRWQVSVAACAGCAVLSSLVSSICVNVYRKKSKGQVKVRQEDQKEGQEDRNTKRQTRRNKKDRGDEVCYASIDVQVLKTKTQKMKPAADLSTYSEVRTAGP